MPKRRRDLHFISMELQYRAIRDPWPMSIIDSRPTIRLSGSLDLEGKIDQLYIYLRRYLLIAQALQSNPSEGLHYVKNTRRLFVHLNISTKTSSCLLTASTPSDDEHSGSASLVASQQYQLIPFLAAITLHLSTDRSNFYRSASFQLTRLRFRITPFQFARYPLSINL